MSIEVCKCSAGYLVSKMREHTADVRVSIGIHRDWRKLS